MPNHDLVVVGAGPAGAEAAIVARGLGLSVLVIDEAADSGGQIYRRGNSGGTVEGNILRARLKASGADIAFEHRVWTMAESGSGFEVAAVGPHTSLVSSSATVIVASGAIERFYPRPGWTLPGVIGLGAATIMIKAHHVLPGQRVLVAGPGPLAPLVASLIIANGGHVVALVDPNPRSAWLKGLPAMASRPDLLLQGAQWIARLLARRVPILHGWDIQAIEGHEHAEFVDLTRVDEAWRPMNSGPNRRFTVDAVCFGYGLFPSTEIYRQLGAELSYHPERGGWIPNVDSGQRTSVARLYVAGDGSALSGVAAAPLSGKLAALSAAADLGKIGESSYRTLCDETRTKLARAIRFTREVARLVQPRASAVEAVPEDTVVCRCEDVTVKDLKDSVRQGSCEINALKAATRCGMGPCGGRMCGEAAAAIMECANVPRGKIGYWTARPPLRPVPIDALTGEFEYNDIPVSEPAPL